MSDHDRRSHAPPPSRTRERWQRPDVSRPAAPARAFLPSADPMVPELDEPEPMHPADLFALLPQAARLDLARGAL